MCAFMKPNLQPALCVVNHVSCLPSDNAGCNVLGMHWGLRLKQIRKAYPMTQAQLAAKAGVKQQMISKLENGTAHTTGDIVKLAAALGVPAEYLRYGHQPREATEGEGACESVMDLPGPYAPGQESHLSQRDLALLDHFHGLTEAQQEVFFRQLQDQKRLNDELLVQLLGRRKAQ